MKFSNVPQSELRQNLRWLIYSRVIFAILLLCSTAFIHFNRSDPVFKSPLLLLYGMIAALFVLSVVYASIRLRVRREILFAYIQIAIDCLAVTDCNFCHGQLRQYFFLSISRRYYLHEYAALSSRQHDHRRCLQFVVSYAGRVGIFGLDSSA